MQARNTWIQRTPFNYTGHVLTIPGQAMAWLQLEPCIATAWPAGHAYWHLTSYCLHATHAVPVCKPRGYS